MFDLNFGQLLSHHTNVTEMISNPNCINASVLFFIFLIYIISLKFSKICFTNNSLLEHFFFQIIML